MPIDPNEAPEGYIAQEAIKADRHEHVCGHCALYVGMCCTLGEGACLSWARKDKTDVVFALKCEPGRRFDMPQRYEVLASGVYEPESDGDWMRAEDVINALKAAGVDFE